ncbi:MAG: thioredoxin family protein [Sulfurimonas sp.]|nr:thioredoxin family protein [Sulfurimonas sp.]MDQ7066797.1 thioredoxin family protein [Sulfurimonas sp.]
MGTEKVVCPECSSINAVEMEKIGDIVECSQCKGDLNHPFALEVSDNQCSKHIRENDIAVLVDFYSTTCGPCMAMYEDYEDAALGFGISVRFLKINADKHQIVAKEYGVSGLPTIIAFKGGKEVNRISRQLSQVELTVWAHSLILPS